jgi:hypothetical protein
MGEIKSTLDLVLEKTKHLNLSLEEKQKQRHDEFVQKVKGTVQKYYDKLIKKDRTKEELISLQKEYGFDYKELLIAEAAKKISIDSDNHSLFGLLEDVCDLKVDGMKNLCADYRTKIASATEQALNKARELFAEKHGISGSSVVPNLEADEAFKLDMQKLRRSFKEALSHEANQLTTVC